METAESQLSSVIYYAMPSDSVFWSAAMLPERVFFTVIMGTSGMQKYSLALQIDFQEDS